MKPVEPARGTVTSEKHFKKESDRTTVRPAKQRREGGSFFPGYFRYLKNPREHVMLMIHKVVYFKMNMTDQLLDIESGNIGCKNSGT